MIPYPFSPPAGITYNTARQRRGLLRELPIIQHARGGKYKILLKRMSPLLGHPSSKISYFKSTRVVTLVTDDIARTVPFPDSLSNVKALFLLGRQLQYDFYQWERIFVVSTLSKVSHNRACFMGTIASTLDGLGR
jgi:hypothetical protein